MTKEMTMPCIHLNGTSATELTAQLTAAYRACNAAIEALQEAAPNARDYYVISPEAYPAARREHEARMHRLADIQHELLAIMENIDEQTDRS